MKISKRQEKIVRQALQHAVAAVRTIPNSAIAEFLPRLQHAQQILTKELKQWETTQDGSQRYTAHTRRSAIAQLDAAIAEVDSLGPAMANTLMTSGLKAGEAGLTAMQQQLASMSAMFEGAIVPIDIDRALILSQGEKLLIKKYPSSAARYAGDIREDIKRRLSVGVLRQQSISEMATQMHKEIPMVFKSARFKAMRLVRTEVMNSYNDSHYAGLVGAHDEDSVVRMRWDASYDFRRCAECADLDGQIVDVDGDFQARWTAASGSARRTTHRRPPAHPNCFIPGTEVQGNFVAGLKAHYEGKMFEILSKSGRSITVTPNHPILTDAGWTPACEITKEHYLLSYGGDVDSTATAMRLDEQQPPPRIDEVFGLFKSASSSRLSPAFAGDLHGDGSFVDGDIEIVWATRPFRGTLNGQDLSDISHPIADSLLLRESGNGGNGDGFSRSFRSTNGGIRSGYLPGLLGTRHSGPLHILSIGPSSALNTIIVKPEVDNISTHAEFLRRLIDGAAGLVALDEVREVREIDYSGHVYDMQTTSGWQVADGIIASNCRCVLVPWMDDFPDTDWNTEAPVQGQPVPDATYVFGRGAHPTPKKTLKAKPSRVEALRNEIVKQKRKLSNLEREWKSIEGRWEKREFLESSGMVEKSHEIDALRRRVSKEMESIVMAQRPGEKISYDDGNARMKTTTDRVRKEIANSHRRAIKKFSVDEREALSSYTGFGFSSVNARLRYDELDRNNFVGTKEKVGHMDSAMRRTRTDRDIVVYRGVDMGVGSMDHLEVGALMHDKGFGSSSLSPGAAMKKNGVFTVEVPAGTHGVHLESITKSPGEDEFLIGRGAKYRVISREGVGKEVHYRLRVESTAMSREGKTNDTKKTAAE